MERVMSIDDKIKKAEEIYYRRKNQENPPRDKIVIEGKKDYKIMKTVNKQIITCIIIYVLFYLITNSNNIFSTDLNEKMNQVLNTDINIVEIYSIISSKLTEAFSEISRQNYFEDENNLKEQEDIKTKEIVEDNVENNIVEENSEIQNEINEENIGGAENEELQIPVESSQLELDVNYIKNEISFIKPVSGVISSKYGLRSPTTTTVPKNHTGTDIAAARGTKIVSATDGQVIMVSSLGDYGKHIQIQIKDVIVVYAHCNKIYVKEGEKVYQGQEVAEVGATGNVTGPHLHFEIRYQERFIDPEMILEL